MAGAREKDPLLADYALYWDAETQLAEQRNDAALAELRQIRQQLLQLFVRQG